MGQITGRSDEEAGVTFFALFRKGKKFSAIDFPLDGFSFFFFIVLLFICAYKAWVISPPCPHSLVKKR
jgi:hypothetical protein